MLCTLPGKMVAIHKMQVNKCRHADCHNISPIGNTYNDDDDDSAASDNCTDDDSITRINQWNNNESTASDSTNSHAGHTSPLWRRPRWRSLALHGRRAHGTSYSNYNY